MIQSATEDSADILARDGVTLHRLNLRTGKVVAPWEMELLRWPPAAEPALRRGGYLGAPQLETELWCNCAD
jgi:hypothetical protein